MTITEQGQLLIHHNMAQIQPATIEVLFVLLLSSNAIIIFAVARKIKIPLIINNVFSISFVLKFEL